MEGVGKEIGRDEELVISDFEEVVAIIDESATSGVPATILIDGRQPVECRTGKCWIDSFELLLESQDCARVLTQSQAQLLINSRGQRWKLRARFESWKWSEVDGLVHVQMLIPSELRAYAYRKESRVSNLGRPLAIECEIDAGSRAFPATVMDLSLDGVGVQFENEGSLPPIDVGHRAVMTLSNDGNAYQVVVQLRWRRGATCGFKFDRPVGQGPEPALIELLDNARSGSEAA